MKARSTNARDRRKYARPVSPRDDGDFGFRGTTASCTPVIMSGRRRGKKATSAKT
jgi:hypothetical protein